VRVDPIFSNYRETVTLRGSVANPGRFLWHQGMRLSELMPDKDSLLSRDYWWRRTQLGLPAPEFVPLGSFASQSQTARFPGQQSASYSGQQSTSYSRQQSGSYPEQQFESFSGQQTDGFPDSSRGTQLQPQPPDGDPSVAMRKALDARSSGASNALAGTEASNQGGRETALLRPAFQTDWDYAVIERLDSSTMATSLIPFDLGKLVLGHDTSQNLELQPGDIVTVFSQDDIRQPVDRQAK
jgi:hypothetical protein